MLLLTVVCAVISSRIDLEEDILDMLPRNDQRVDEYRYALRKFRQIDRVYLDVGVNTDDPEKLAHAADAVFAALSTNSAFVRIMYRIEVGGSRQVVDYLTGALPNLFTDADAQALAPKLEPAAVREHLTDNAPPTRRAGRHGDQGRGRRGSGRHERAGAGESPAAANRLRRRANCGGAASPAAMAGMC